MPSKRVTITLSEEEAAELAVYARGAGLDQKAAAQRVFDQALAALGGRNNALGNIVAKREAEAAAKAARVLAIMVYIREHPEENKKWADRRATKAQFARRFGVDERTIYRDYRTAERALLRETALAQSASIA